MLQYIVGGLRTALQSVTSQIFLFRVPFDCTLEGIDVSIGASVPSGGVAATFNFRAGADPASLATVFASPSDRPSITAGNSSASLSGLSLALVKGWLVVDLDSLPSGGVAAPVFVSLTVDDGVNVSLTVQEADGSPSFAATTLQVGNGDLTQPTTGVARIKTAADALAQLLTGGKIDPTLLPGLAITDKFIATSDGAMTALAAQQGDVCFRTDLSEVYLLAGTDPTVLSNWVQWLHPAIPTTLPPSGAAGGDLDAASTYPNPTVAKVRQRSFAGIPLPPVGAVGDNFNDNSIDGSLWSQIDGAHLALEQNHRLELQPCAGAFSGLALAAQNFTNHSSQVAVIQTQSDSMTMLWNVAGGAYAVHFMARSSTGNLWPFIYGPSGFVTSGPQTIAVVSGMLIRIRHVSSGDTIYFDYSTDGGATWTTLHSYAGLGQPLTGVTLHLRHYDTAGVSIFDSFSTDIGTDPIAAHDGEALVWSQTRNQIEFAALQGFLPTVNGDPGAQSVPSGKTLLFADLVNHRLVMVNPNTGHRDYVDLPGTY